MGYKASRMSTTSTDSGRHQRLRSYDLMALYKYAYYYNYYHHHHHLPNIKHGGQYQEAVRNLALTQPRPRQ